MGTAWGQHKTHQAGCRRVLSPSEWSPGCAGHRQRAAGTASSWQAVGHGNCSHVGLQAEGKREGGWGGGQEERRIPAPPCLHHEHPKHVTSPATLSLGGLSPARLSPQPHAEHHALPPPCCHPPCCPSSQRRAKPLLHHPQVLAPSRPGPSLSQYQDRDLLLLLLLFKKKSLPGRWGRAGSTAQVEELEMVPSALPSPAPAEQRRGLGAAARHRQMRRKTHFSNSEVINY